MSSPHPKTHRKSYTNSVDPWKDLLRRYFPSMAAPGSFLQQQKHRLFSRTAKELLGLRISDASPQVRGK